MKGLQGAVRLEEWIRRGDRILWACGYDTLGAFIWTPNYVIRSRLR